MWIILRGGSLQITAADAMASSELFVNGRGVLDRLFPDVEIASATDMHFHESAIIDRDSVAEAIASEIRAIAYESFEPDPSDLDPNAGGALAARHAHAARQLCFGLGGCATGRAL